jgi:probable F420-dependent oxidoreductase
MQPAPLARAMEERGFESLWVPEHTHIPSSRKSSYPASGGLVQAYYELMDPFLALNTAATVTSKLKVGTGIALITQRDPIVTAKMVSSIDQLSGGRFLFGVGNGWNQDEMENHGTDFESRHKLVRERIEAMKVIWTKAKAEYHGDMVKFDPMMAWPKPVQKPHPPVLVGGAFPYGARRAVRYGDGWMPLRRRKAYGEVRDLIPKFHAMAKEANRDLASLPVSIWESKEDESELKRDQDAGVVRVIVSLDSEKSDKILPILDRWAKLAQKVA